MRNMIKIAAVLAIVGAVAVVALAGESLANTGSAGNQQGMMSGQGCGHMGASYGSDNDHSCNGDCSMYRNATTCQDHISGQMAQNNCGDRCDQDVRNCTCDNQCACCDGPVSSVTSE